MAAKLPVTEIVVAPGFEKVRDAFLSNFEEEGGEHGAGLCIYVAGKPVIEMYAGYADEEKTKPYTKDNLNIVHSSGKAVMSLTIAHLVGEGKLDYDEKVSKYWPEFAAGNKGDVTLGQLCAHAGGVSWLDKEFMPTVEDIQMGNQDALEKKIAGQPHNQGGTTTKSYHAITRGWFLNALVRRVTGGKTHGDIFREIVNKKLGVDVYCGLPKDQHHRVSLVREEALLQGQMAVMLGDPTTPIYKAFQPIIGSDNLGLTVPSNDPKIWTGESSAAFTLTNASSLGRLAGLMAMGGSLDGFEYVKPAAFAKANKVHEGVAELVDLCLGTPVPYTHGGFAQSLPGLSVPMYLFDMTVQPPKPLYTPEMMLPGWTWTGWFGYGGSVFQWAPEKQVGFGYVPNLMRAGVLGDGRSAKICAAFTECYEALNKK